MRILKIVFLLLLILVVILVVAAAIFIKTLDVNKYKPQIVAQAEKVLGRRVDFRDASLGLGWHGIGLRLSGLSVAEDPAFGTGEFLSVKTISVGVDVIGYLFRRRISVTSILIDSPSVTVIRDMQGAVNAQSIAAAPPEQSPAVAAPAAIPALFVASLKGQNGKVTYIDRTFDPPLTVTVDQLDFAVSRLSLTDPFPFEIQASLFSDKQNLRIAGKCQLDLKKNSASVFDLKADSDLSRLALKEIPHAVPMVPAQVLPSELKGELIVTVPRLEAGSKGLGALKAQVDLIRGQAKFPQMGAPVSAISADVLVTEKDVMLNSFSASMGAGSVRGSGWIKNYLAGQDFDLAFNADKLSLADLLAQGTMPVQMEGIIAAKGQVKGHGFTPEALRSNLVGEAVVDVRGAMLKGVNVLNAVLDRLAVIPGLGEAVKAGLPEAYQQKLQRKDTVFNDFTVPLTIVSGKALVKETAVSSEGLFIFRAKGDAGFDGTFTLEGAFLLAPELSKALVDRVKQAQYLLNEERMVYIPLRVSGAAGATIQFTVDASYITKKILENQARQQILKGLDKYLGGQQEGQPQGEQAPPQGQELSNATRAVEDALKNLFK